LAATFIASAALSAVASVVQWKTIPHVRLSSAQSSASSVNTSTRERAGLIWTASLGIGTAGYLVLHAIAPQFAALALVAAALVGLVMTSDSLHRLWKNPTLRAGSLLSMTYAFVMFPISGILIPFAAKDLNGGAQLQGQLQGSLFFGQLLAGSTMLKLPGRWNTGVRIGVLGALGAWLGFYLFPANLALAAGGAAVATALYAVSSVLTDRGWMRYAFVGLSALALPLFFWGNIPALLLGVLIVGLVNVPNKITIDTVVQSEAKADSANTGSLLGARSALNGIAAAFGYASVGAIFAAFHPALPAALSPILGMFAGIGALLFAASFWLASKLSKKDFAWPGKSAAAPVAREYSVDEIAQSLADRIRSGGIRAIVTDYDGTLEDKTPDDKAVPASAELTGLLGRLRERGVAVAVSTNHFFTGDHNGMTHLLGDRMTEKDRAGMMFVVQSGARVYQYDAAGATPAEPAWKEVSFDDAERARIQPVFEAAAAKLGLSPDDYKIFHEDSRSLIEIRNRKGDEETRLAEEMYALLNQANKENGFGYLVQLKPMPTMRFVPYVQYFKAHKGTGARKAVEMLKANGSIDDESQVVIFGDDFKPEGNDLYMAQALPRALAVSVGKNSDPSQPNVMQAAVRGAATTREILARLNELLSATPQ
jgi:hypothetical protein